MQALRRQREGVNLNSAVCAIPLFKKDLDQNAGYTFTGTDEGSVVAALDRAFTDYRCELGIR